jgi:hypothetical protein
MTRFGRSAGFPAARRALPPPFEREPGEYPDAALFQLGGVPVLVLADEVLSRDSPINLAACGSIQVVTNVARFSRGLPSSISSPRGNW